MKFRRILAAIVCSVLAVELANAADLANDVASDAAYNSGWTNESNGGTGFGAWTQSGSTNGSNGGYFPGSSTGNGDGDSDADGDIDTSGEALNIYANGGQTVSATRTFTGGSLSVGQTFQIGFDNGWIDTGGNVSFILETSTGTDRLEFRFTGDTPNYVLIDNSGTVDTGIGFTDEGLLLNVTLTGADAYSVEIITLNGTPATNTFSGTLAASGGVDQFNLVNASAGPDGERNAAWNSFAVIPEPSTMALTSLGMLGLGILRRRRLAK
jgi:hypothetical protein